MSKIKIMVLYLSFIILMTSFPVSAAEPQEASFSEQVKLSEDIKDFVFETAESYDISPFLIFAMIERESSYQVDAENGDCKGLMQVSEKWHKDRMEELGCDDIMDAYDNILTGTDFLGELFRKYQDPILVLMVYNMKISTAKRLYKEGRYSSYALGILERAEELETLYEEEETSASFSC